MIKVTFNWDYDKLCLIWYLNKMNEVTVCVTDGGLTEGQQNSKCRCSLGLCLCLGYRSS